VTRSSPLRPSGLLRAQAQPPPKLVDGMVTAGSSALVGGFVQMLNEVLQVALVLVAFAVVASVYLLRKSASSTSGHTGVGLLVAVGVGGLLLGLLLSWLIFGDDGDDVPPPPTVTVNVRQPNGSVSCTNPSDDAFCQFEVTGVSTGVASSRNLRLYVFVFPVQPPGAGWYAQKASAVVRSDGQWIQGPSYVGNEESPAKRGDTLRLRAAVVQQDARYRGFRLGDLGPGEALESIEDVDGLVALSNPVDLRVSR
jgi:hypothetical protein